MTLLAPAQLMRYAAQQGDKVGHPLEVSDSDGIGPLRRACGRRRGLPGRQPGIAGRNDWLQKTGCSCRHRQNSSHFMRFNTFLTRGYRADGIWRRPPLAQHQMP